jgi:hypothetical protein
MVDGFPKCALLNQRDPQDLVLKVLVFGVEKMHADKRDSFFVVVKLDNLYSFLIFFLLKVGRRKLPIFCMTNYDMCIHLYP